CVERKMCCSVVKYLHKLVSNPQGLPCGNSFALGYKGVSLGSSNHRQSGMKGNSTHTGLPNAPARLTTDVSLEITRSKDIIIAAVSRKSFISSSTRTMP